MVAQNRYSIPESLKSCNNGTLVFVLSVRGGMFQDLKRRHDEISMLQVFQYV